MGGKTESMNVHMDGLCDLFVSTVHGCIPSFNTKSVK